VDRHLEFVAGRCVTRLRASANSTRSAETSTGKVQKFVLREQEWAGQDKRIGGA
jgi:hypothetical protein